nr:MAG TPA: hypothetical protein [Caudoviricetes sp.]
MQVLKVGDKYLSIDDKLLSIQNNSGVVTIITAGDSTSRVVMNGDKAVSH